MCEGVESTKEGEEAVSVKGADTEMTNGLGPEEGSSETGAWSTEGASRGEDDKSGA